MEFQTKFYVFLNKVCGNNTTQMGLLLTYHVCYQTLLHSTSDLTQRNHLTGYVYGYEIYEVTTNNGIETETFVDSCWGYYGDEHCMEEAESIVV